jgi:tetratricopeptide (TPR) repeat protein
VCSSDLFDRSMELKPEDAKAWAGKGSALKFMGNYEEAIECLEKFIELASGDISSQIEEAWAMIFDLKLLLSQKKGTDL